jgi:hypothetical protein
MANKPAKRRVQGRPGQAAGGRTTPKGGPTTEGRPGASSRYTPPIPKSQKVSPMWVPILMFGLLGLGLVVIFCDYLGILPGGTSNGYLLVGLGLILAGIITATQYH